MNINQQLAQYAEYAPSVVSSSTVILPPPPRYLNETFICCVYVIYCFASSKLLGGEVVPVNTHLDALHNQVQEAVHRLFHVGRGAGGGLKVGQTENFTRKIHFLHNQMARTTTPTDRPVAWPEPC
jgi:hypothetical protein